MQNLNQLIVKTNSGQEYSLADYHGKVLLIVNTASRCAFTSQYKALEQLYQTYQGLNFEVLAFPCNDFASQEPGSNEEIKNFCDLNYQITFTVFEKIITKGSAKHPLYRYLTEQSGQEFQGEIKWNFTKFLLDQDGVVCARYSPLRSPNSKKIKLKIEELLKN